MTKPLPSRLQERLLASGSLPVEKVYRVLVTAPPALPEKVQAGTQSHPSPSKVLSYEHPRLPGTSSL